MPANRLLSPRVFQIAGWTAAIALLLMCTPSAQAQRVPGSIGIGGQLGSPSGVTLKLYNTSGASYDFLAAWDLDDFFFLNAHAQFESPVEAENVEDLYYFFGPGVFLGVQDRGSRDGDDDVVLGISGRLGLNYMVAPDFELFAQLTPRLNLVPDTDGDIGGGIGLRYYP